MSILPIKSVNNNTDKPKKVNVIDTDNILTEQVDTVTIDPIESTVEGYAPKEPVIEPIDPEGKTPDEIYSEIRKVAKDSYGEDLIKTSESKESLKRINQFLSNSPNAHMLISDLSAMLASTYNYFNETLNQHIVDNENSFTNYDQEILDLQNADTAIINELVDIHNDITQLDISIRNDIAQDLDNQYILITDETNVKLAELDNNLTTYIDNGLNAQSVFNADTYLTIDVFENELANLVSDAEFQNIVQQVNQNTSDIANWQTQLQHEINVRQQQDNIHQELINNLTNELATLELNGFRMFSGGNPIPPYNVNDLWLKYDTIPSTGVLYLATTGKPTGTFDAADWEVAIDTSIAKSKNTVHIGGTDPSANWTTVDDKRDNTNDEWRTDSLNISTYVLSYYYRETATDVFEWVLATSQFLTIEVDNATMNALTTGNFTDKYIVIDNGVLKTIDALKRSIVTTGASFTPSGDAKDNEYFITALSADAIIAAPDGTAENGNTLVVRIVDNGTSRALTWNAVYVGKRLPAATIPNQTLYCGFEYNDEKSVWELSGFWDGEL